MRRSAVQPGRATVNLPVQVDRRSFPEQVLLVGPGPGDGGPDPGLVHEPLGSAGADLGVPAERGIHRADRYFHTLVLVGVGVGRVLLSDWASPSSVLPGPSGGREARVVPRRWALVHRSLFPLRPRSGGRYSWVRLTRGRRTRPEAHTGWG